MEASPEGHSDSQRIVTPVAPRAQVIMVAFKAAGSLTCLDLTSP